MRHRRQRHRALCHDARGDHPIVLVTGFDSFQDPDRFDNAIMNLTDISGLASEWLGNAYVGCVRYGGENWGKRFERMLDLWKSK